VGTENQDEFQDEFERELRQAFARRPAPPSLKRRLMERGVLKMKRPPQAERQVERSFVTWQRLAASVALTAALAGGIQWRILDQRRKEQAARDQVFLALRVTSHALNQMNARLAAHHHGGQE
jgi:anti-sigma-K factor RskA